MITTPEQFKVALHQLASFKGMLEAMKPVKQTPTYSAK